MLPVSWDTFRDSIPPAGYSGGCPQWPGTKSDYIYRQSSNDDLVFSIPYRLSTESLWSRSSHRLPAQSPRFLHISEYLPVLGTDVIVYRKCHVTLFGTQCTRTERRNGGCCTGCSESCRGYGTKAVRTHLPRYLQKTNDHTNVDAALARPLPDLRNEPSSFPLSDSSRGPCLQ